MTSEWIKGRDYIVIPELPQEQQAPFTDWISNQTMPIIKEEGDNRYECAYKCSYDRWFHYWKKGQEAKVDD